MTDGGIADTESGRLIHLIDAAAVSATMINPLTALPPAGMSKERRCSRRNSMAGVGLGLEDLQKIANRTSEAAIMMTARAIDNERKDKASRGRCRL